MLMRVNSRCHICLQQAAIVNYFADVIWSYTTVPVAFGLPFLCICTNMEEEVQERYLPIIRGAGTPFPCHSQATLTLLALMLSWVRVALRTADINTHTHPFNGPFSGTTRVSRYQKGKTNLDFTEVSGSSISWAICKFALRSRQITTPAPHHTVRERGCPLTQIPGSAPAFHPSSRVVRKFGYLQNLGHLPLKPCTYRINFATASRWSQSVVSSAWWR